MEMTQAQRDNKDAYWLYWGYQAACTSGMVTWARKKHKGELSGLERYGGFAITEGDNSRRIGCRGT